jgi:glycerophosphoryl diester phosphodiesterase
VIVSSFQAATLRAVQAADCRLALGALWGFGTEAGPALLAAAEAGFGAVHPFLLSVTPGLIEEAHTMGLAVNVWTVNAPEDLRAMMAAGVDTVITDRLQDALAAAAAGIS